TLYNVCAIAFDCWLTLEKPLGILRRRKHIAKVMIISIWLFPLAFWSITIVVLRVFSGDLVSSAHSCNVNWKPKFLVFIVMSVLFYLPVLIDFYAFMKPSANNCRCAKWMYAKKTIELESTPFKQQLLPVDSTAGKAKFEICCTDDEELVDSQENASSAKCHRGGSYLNKRSYSCVELTHLRQSIPSKCNNILLSYKESVTALSEFLNRKIKCQMKATRAVGVILLIFLLTWLPILIVWPLKVYCNDCISNSVFRWATWMNYINSAINPLIYSWNCPRFQRVFKEKICTKIKCL
ncbi:unnamed protein product, partial [Soboliphyme baturini]|uniref:G_PROTEIN_RECEP_F1_2 domain-containing protein n=1 Tax=Soboliphyme baturini TaxID=241478 RepID=A0A183J1T8_9BILA